MTENQNTEGSSEVARWSPPPATVTRIVDTDSWTQMMRPIIALANEVAGTEFVPAAMQGRPDKITAAVLHGREVGLPPMTALAMTDVIQGKPSLTAEGMRSLAFAAGHEIAYPESTSVRCVARGRRRGSEDWTTVVWSIEDARLAGLLSKDTWKRHPRRMLQARATSELCKMIFPDVLHGMASAEEMADADGIDAATGEVLGGPPPESGRRTTVQRGKRKPPPPPADTAGPEVPEIPPPPVQAPEPATAPDAAAESVPVPPPTPEPQGEPTGPPEAEQAVSEPIAEPPKVSGAQLRMLGASWSNLGVTDTDTRRDYTAALVGRDLAEGSTKDLTKREASGLIDLLQRCKDLAEVEAAMQERIAKRGGDTA